MPSTTNDAGAGAVNFDALSQIGPYVLGKKLGEGSFAAVRRAKHVITGVDVAIKIFVKAAIVDDYVKEHLRREADIMKKLQHPSLIRLFEILETADLYCLVMEVCEKDVLSHLCSVGVSSEVQARNYGRQLISAFEYLHSKEIVHRDLKPENMMIDKGSSLKIIDFGLSNDMTGKDMLTTQCGSMAYSAPELLSSKPYGKEVDIWSIGVCLYVMLTGHLPFGNENLTELHALMLDGSYELPDIMSDSLKDLFTRIFQVKPKKRITIAELWEHEWIAGDVDDGDRMSPLPVKDESVTEDTINMALVTQMVNMGFASKLTVIASVVENKCDRACATYHLLLLKAQQQRLKAAKQKRSSRSSLTRSGSSSSLRRRSGSISASTPPTRRSSTLLQPLSRPASRSDRLSPQPPDRSPSPNVNRRRTLSRQNNSDRSLTSSATSDDGRRRSKTESSSEWSPVTEDDDAGLTFGGSRSSISSRGGSALSRGGSAGTLSPVFLLFPPGLDYETISYGDAIGAIVSILISCGGQLDSDVFDELKDAIFRALRVAPDTELVCILRKLGWSGLTFADAHAICDPLLDALMPINHRLSAEDGTVAEDGPARPPLRRTSSSRSLSTSSDVDGLQSRRDRTGSFASKGNVLPQIGRPPSGDLSQSPSSRPSSITSTRDRPATTLMGSTRDRSGSVTSTHSRDRSGSISSNHSTHSRERSGSVSSTHSTHSRERSGSQSTGTTRDRAGSISRERSPQPPRRTMRRSSSSTFAPDNRGSATGLRLRRCDSNDERTPARPGTRAGGPTSPHLSRTVPAKQLEAKLNRLRSGLSPIAGLDKYSEDHDDSTPPASPEERVLLSPTTCAEDYRRGGRRRLGSVGTSARSSGNRPIPSGPSRPNTIQTGFRARRSISDC